MHSAAKMAAITLVGLVLTTAPASAATVEGQWSMTVTSSSPTVTKDNSGDSSIDLQGDYSSVSGADGEALRFGFDSNASLGMATSSGVFNPGTAPFAVAAYLKTTTVPRTGGYSPNVVQKGSFKSNDQWKMQLEATADGTVADCRFAGSSLPGGAVVQDRTGTALDDGQWHEVVCWRENGRYGITVDGTNTARNGDPGAISTPRSLRIANKGPRAGVTDQFQGDLDCVTYVDGPSPRALAESQVPC